MNVFIGWSGDRSKQAALELRNWLPKVIQAITPWMSEWDIKAGARWLVELIEQLEKTNFGVIALTSDNLGEPWIHFEAGALAKQVRESAVCPYLIDIADKSAVAGPLAQFQIKKANKEDTLSLLKNINLCLGNEKLADNVLTETFGRWWPDLEKAFKSLPTAAAKEPQRTERELLEEIVERVRSLDRETSTFPRPLPLRSTSQAAATLARWLTSQPTVADEEIQKYLTLISAANIRQLREVTHGDASAKASEPAKPEKKKNGEPEEDN